jgi:HAD superfamily hydrolase (TIGR01509 family)
MIKAILFDADGVLINGEMFSTVLERDYGIPPEKTLPFFQGIFQETIIGNADLKEIIAPHLKKWGWNKSVDELLETWFTAEHSTDEELIAYIQQLRKDGIVCCLATNQEKYRIAYMLEHMGFKDAFDKIFASAHMGFMKPDVRFFAKAFEDLRDVEKGEVLFWDDSPKKVAGAKEFGIHAEVYTTFEDFKEKMRGYL